MSALAMLVSNIAHCDYGTLPADTVEATKKQVLDTLGVIIAGSTSRKMGDLVDLVKEWGGKAESTIIGFGGKVPSPNAALVNGTLSNVWDYDDIHDTAAIHVSRSIVPASLAMAERVGRVSGKDLIVAIAVGFDLAARLSRATLVRPVILGWELASAYNYFGAAASAGKIIGLSEKSLTDALGIAFQQASAGAGPVVSEGPSTKGLHGGLSAQGGIVAALIAQKGLTAVSDCLEGKSGFYNTFFRNLYNPAFLTVNLGRVFEGATNSQKLYPCCRYTHAPIEATLALVKQYDIKPEDVAGVTAYVGGVAFVLCEPLKIRQSPENAVQAQFSIPWTIASAIMYRKVGIEEFRDSALQNRGTVALAQKVVPKLAPELRGRSIVEPAIVEIKLKNGQVYSERVDSVTGSTEKPVSFGDIAQKFRYCCGHGVKPIPGATIDQVIEMVEHLETLPDTGEIIRLLG